VIQVIRTIKPCLKLPLFGAFLTFSSHRSRQGPACRMAALVHCVRHAQGWHNIQGHDPTLFDPRLTPLGREQCRALRESFKGRESKIALIVTSPLCRTIQTALLAFYPEATGEICSSRILALPEAQETSPLPCDIGLDPDELKELCKDRNWPVNLSMVKPGWNCKEDSSRFAATDPALKERARKLRCMLYREAQRLPSQDGRMPEIVLVSHGQFLHYFTEDWEHATKHQGTGWGNCELRSYELQPHVSNGGQSPFVLETVESRRKRGLDAGISTPGLHGDMCAKALEDWHDQGAFSPRLGPLA